MSEKLIDEEKIIRCENCKWYETEECRWREDESPDEDDFCSYAEQRPQTPIDVFAGKTIVCSKISGYGIYMEFSDGTTFYYDATDGGMSCWEIGE